MSKKSFAWAATQLLSIVGAMAFVLAAVNYGISQEEPKKEDPAKKEKADDAKKEKADDAKKEDAKPEEPKLGAPSGGAQATATINEQLAKFWAANSIRPSRRATDNEFVRRIYLDLLGRIPAAWEVKEYLSDYSNAKRARLINKLLNEKRYSSEFEDHWADIWTTLLLTRSGNRVYHEQLHTFLAEEFGKNRPWDQIVRKLLTANGENNDKGEVNFILAHVGDAQRNGAAEEEGQFDMVPITSRSMRLFLGIQIQCSQCHDHPTNTELKQSHFWGVNAFFRQVQRDGNPIMRNNNQPNMAAKLGLKDNSSFNKGGIVYYEKRVGVVEAVTAKFLDGKALAADFKGSRRDALADYLIAHDMFGKAMVNRLWGHFFGRSLTTNKTVDDFGEHNQIVHEELLTKVAEEFKNYKYDIRQLMSWICNSEAYNLSVEANPTNMKHEHEISFSRMLLKNMTPEQLYESLKVALDQPVKSKEKDKSVVTPSGATPTRQPTGRRNNQGREEWLAKLTRNFGDDEGNEITFNGTVVQALLMMNGGELQRELTRTGNNTIANAMKGRSGNRAILDELCMVALGRPATAKEMSAVTAAGKTGGGSPQQFWEDVLWALLNTNEFVLNH
jgi:hypothetical protein